MHVLYPLLKSASRIMIESFMVYLSLAFPVHCSCKSRGRRGKSIRSGDELDKELYLVDDIYTHLPPAILYTKHFLLYKT